MTEGYWARYESVIDQQIRMAQERGDFDDLPGKGKPLPGLDNADDENWWVKEFIRREGLPSEALLPTPLQLRREVERLPETVRHMRTEEAVRVAVSDLNSRIVAWLRAPSGPTVLVRPVKADDVVRQWREHRARPPAAASPPPAAEEAPRRSSRQSSWWRRVMRRG